MQRKATSKAALIRAQRLQEGMAGLNQRADNADNDWNPEPSVQIRRSTGSDQPATVSDIRVMEGGIAYLWENSR
jgi:hypothetical protein